MNFDIKATLGALSLFAAQSLSSKLGVRDIRCKAATIRGGSSVYDDRSDTGTVVVQEIHETEPIDNLFDTCALKAHVENLTEALAARVPDPKLLFCKMVEPFPCTGAHAEHGFSAGVVVRALVCYNPREFRPQLTLSVCVGGISADVIN